MARWRLEDGLWRSIHGAQQAGVAVCGAQEFYIGDETEAEVHERGLGHANLQEEFADALVAGGAGFGATEQQFEEPDLAKVATALQRIRAAAAEVRMWWR